MNVDRCHTLKRDNARSIAAERGRRAGRIETTGEAERQARNRIRRQCARSTMTMKSMMLCIGAAAAVGFVGRIALLQVGRVRDDESPASLRATTISHQSTDEIFDTAAIDSSDNYYIFLQRFPLQGTFKMLFHTEVVVCPSKAFDQDTVFLNTLNSLLSTLEPSRFERGGGTSVKSTAATAPFAAVPKGQWAKQASPSCVQMGYGGSSCPTSCCGAPHRDKQRGYPLNSQMAVIGNAMGEEKELYLYGTSETISGSDAYKVSPPPTWKHLYAGYTFSLLLRLCATDT